MAYLEVRGLTKSYPGVHAVDDVSFSAEKGEILALLGPSGCGKTTTLNLVAGFITPDSGRIVVGGKDLSHVPPHRRDMAMVFQSYALFPHMTVDKNVAFGLDMRGTGKAEVKERLTEAFQLIQLEGVGRRYPRELSGGQQQRIALARALVVRPAVLLLDEPLSNLDALLRKTMREEMRRILKRVETTAILVTHDQEEALVTADRIILMSSGRVEQIAEPRELYERPTTVFGARFMEVGNLLTGVVRGKEKGALVVETPIGPIFAEPRELPTGSSVTLAIRPENIALAPGAGENHAIGRVERDSYHGSVRRLDVSIGNETLIVHVATRLCPERFADAVVLSWPASETRVLASAKASSADVSARRRLIAAAKG